MLLVNTDYITGKKLETISYVSGSRFVMTVIDSKSIDRAMQSMIEEAKGLYADAIINVRYAPSTNHAYVSGTAVKFV